ncbi:hypothetical protein J6590_036116 [Homalodisca vitripennis]|nr:hypothetical protein J6590_036116 [Homalodisca vitripennis]
MAELVFDGFTARSAVTEQLRSPLQQGSVFATCSIRIRGTRAPSVMTSALWEDNYGKRSRELSSVKIKYGRGVEWRARGIDLERKGVGRGRGMRVQVQVQIDAARVIVTADTRVVLPCATYRVAGVPRLRNWDRHKPGQGYECNDLHVHTAARGLHPYFPARVRT